jgi:hypothetical protein
MTRRTTRILWGLIGICLISSAAISIGGFYGLPGWMRGMDLRRLEILIDVMALLFWMLIFGIYWANKK